MSRSRKLPIIKDRCSKKIYHRTIKRRIRNYIRSHFFKLIDDNFDDVIPNFKSIVNNYDYSDYTCNLMNSQDIDLKNKWSRK